MHKKYYILLLSFFLITQLFSEGLDTLSINKLDLSACAKIDSIKDLLIENKALGPLYAMKNIDKGINISKNCNNPLLKGDLYNLKGNIFLNNGNINQASIYFKKAFEIFQKENDAIGLSNCYINFGLMVKDPDKQIDFYTKAIQYSEKTPHKKGVASALNNIGVIYESLNQIDKAEVYYHKAFEKFKMQDDTLGMAASYSNFGEIERLKLNDQEAINYYHLSMACFTSVKEYRGLAFVNHKIGHLYYDLGKLDSAMFYLERCDSILQFNINSDIKLDLYETLSDLYHKSEVHQKAYLYSKKYIALSDSINQISNKNKIETLEYEVAQIQAREQIELLKQKEKVNQLKRYLLLFGLLLVLIVGVLIVLSLRAKIRREKIISKQNIEINRLEKEKLKNELDYKNKELTDSAIHIVQKNDFFDEIKQQIKDIRNQKPSKEVIDKLNEVSLTLNKNINISQSRKDFELNISDAHKDFFYNLKQKYPDLTHQELRLLGMLLLNLSSKEIATILNINTASVNTKRYRLRKKLNLDADLSFEQFFDTCL